MVFIGGPRQTGKTTVAFHLLGNANESHPAYLNWDVPTVKRSLLKGELPADQKLIVLDEIHKYRGWRNLVKGFYDQHKSTKRFLITGSARLDYYRRGGDSLQGRYHYYRLHPLSLSELDSKPNQKCLDQLLTFGGFPEPFLKANTRHHKRWQRERLMRVIQEDLISLEQVKEVSQLDLLIHILPERVGSILSLNNLKQDLQVSFETVDRWILILENIYYCYRIAPFGLPRLRTAKKEKKLYLWDWSQCEDLSTRFENLVASHLLKMCHFIEDTEGDEMDLQFIRDAQKREIDFVVIKNRKPLFAVECKTGESSLSPHISYFSERSSVPKFYQVHLGTKDIEIAKYRARITPFMKFCQLPWLK
ncbi:MAG: ATP-binding protein [Chlamydiae bacterium]|nr:ATP-binding protein [Chlamydiota bacterium]MBI3267030.1 ATP-binding protein [Chlamydiota bacterium]